MVTFRLVITVPVALRLSIWRVARTRVLHSNLMTVLWILLHFSLQHLTFRFWVQLRCHFEQLARIRNQETAQILPIQSISLLIILYIEGWVQTRGYEIWGQRPPDRLLLFFRHAIELITNKVVRQLCIWFLNQLLQWHYPLNISQVHLALYGLNLRLCKLFWYYGQVYLLLTSSLVIVDILSIHKHFRSIEHSRLIVVWFRFNIYILCTVGIIIGSHLLRIHLFYLTIRIILVKFRRLRTWSQIGLIFEKFIEFVISLKRCLLFEIYFTETAF